MFRRSFSSRVAVRIGSFGTSVVVVSAMMLGLSTPSAGAVSPGWPSNSVTQTRTTYTICRANGGSISANNEADQTTDTTVTAPDYVQPGQTYNIKIRPSLSIYPATQTAPVVGTATVVAIYNQITKYAIPAGATINSATLGPVNGNIDANAEAGYYVAKADVPASAWASPPTPFDPVTQLAHSKLIAIPGTAPAVKFDSATNRVRVGLLGTGGEGTSPAPSVFQGGSAVQGPTLTINVTAPTSGPLGTNLAVTSAGSLPAGANLNAPASGQPDNIDGPDAITVDQTNLTSSDTVWPDPSYVNYVYTTVLGGLVKVIAKAACAPGYENNSDLGSTPPAYMSPPLSLANGVAPPLNDTILTGIMAPLDGAHYAVGQVVTASYSCVGMAHFDGDPDHCVGDLANGAPVDTSSPGSFSFNVSAGDGGGTSVGSASYTVAANTPPVANAGPNQTGKKTNDVITLDGSASSDANTNDAITYSWQQTSGTTVTLSSSTAVKPTFTLPPSPTFTYPNSLQFQLTVTDSLGASTTSNVSVGVVATAPTLGTVAKTPTSPFAGDTVTLSVPVTNPDGGALSYAWTQISGRTAALSSGSAVSPTFTMPASGAANPPTATCSSGTTTPVSTTNANCPRYQVIVTPTQTGAAATAASALAAYAATAPGKPVAVPGAAQTVSSAGGLVTLDGSGTQAQSHTLTYAWTQTGGPGVALSSNTAPKPTFTLGAGAPSATAYTFSLVVTDPQNPITGVVSGTPANQSTAVTTTVTQVADHVVANAGPNQTGKVAGNVITLDASASTSPSLAPLTYSWAQVSNGAPTITLSDSGAQKPTFTAPPAAAPSGYVAAFNVTVSNADGSDTTTTPVTITVGASTPTVGAPTKARDGGGATFFTGDKVTLSVAITNPDGTAEGDYSYVWTQSSGVTAVLSSTTAAHPTFIIPTQTNGTSACVSGTGATGCPEYKVTVTKIDTGKPSALSATLANYASTLANRPVANAGPTQTVKVGTATVTLDGSGSSQAQGHPITYAWTAPGGVTLSSSTAQQPTFSAPNTPASYVFSLVVTDTQNGVTGNGTNGKTSTASTVTVNVSDYDAPVANAGTNQSVLVATTGVQLDASGSSQTDNHTLTYHWTQTGGTAVTLSNANVKKPTFTAPNAGANLTFTVTVTDTQNPNPAVATVTSSPVTVFVNNFAAPIASAGSNQGVHVKDTGVTLDASGSSQVDHHTLTYQWTQTAGTTVTLSSSTVIHPTFTAPAAPSVLKFTVTVTDTQNPNPDPEGRATTSSAVSITVSTYPAPTANAGPDQPHAASGSVVHLDGSGSSDPTHFPLTYTWTQVGGPHVTLSNAHAVKPTFTTTVDPSAISFQLQVDNGFYAGTNTDTVSINTDGIPGLDFSAATTLKKGQLQATKASDNFTVTVKNVGTTFQSVSPAIVQGTVFVNSVNVSANVHLTSTKTVPLRPGQSTGFKFVWTHGSDLHLGDTVVITGCVGYPGDFTPGNNCSTAGEALLPINLFPSALKVGRVAPTNSSNGVTVTIKNGGTHAASPVLAGMTRVWVRVGNGAVVELPTPAVAAQLIKSGGTHQYKFTWAHHSVSHGSAITFVACFVLPGNTAVNSCTVSTQTT